MSTGPFYRHGLCFSCLRCSSCCRYEGGYVFLSQKDIALLAADRKMEYTDFVKTYCRWVPFENWKYLLSLKEKSNKDCIFWKDGCSVYHARPMQCRTFPFWASIVASGESWRLAASGCPGMGQGVLHTREEIDRILKAQAAEPVLSKKSRETRGI